MKKGQEEIVGFVMIMLVMVVVLLVFLGLTLRNNNKSETRDSREIYQFLESIGEYTTDCQIRSSEYADLSELFEKCRSNDDCLNEKDSCAVLNETLKGLFESSWNVGPEASIKGYEFTSIYESGEREEEIASLNLGVCNGSIIGANYFLPAFPGKITSTLKLCY